MSRSIDNTDLFGQNQVHMSSTKFSRREIHIKKGQSITLFAEDTHTSYTILSGRWENLKLLQPTVPGTPAIGKGKVVDGMLQIIIGPFNTAGRFEFCRKEREGMNLIVYVHVA